MELYDVYIRRWWAEAAPDERHKWPKGLVPKLGRKTYLARRVSRDQALEICERYNTTHNPGRYSLKAEFTRS